jgi:hypothetical protein
MFSLGAINGGITLNRTPPVVIASMRTSLSADKDRERNADNRIKEWEWKWDLNFTVTRL